MLGVVLGDRGMGGGGEGARGKGVGGRNGRGVWGNGEGMDRVGVVGAKDHRKQRRKSGALVEEEEEEEWEKMRCGEERSK